MSEQKLSKHVDQLTVAVGQVQRALEPILKQPLSEVLPKLSTIQRCELEALVAYSIDTLFWIFLKINGIPPKEHPVMKELQRVQRYIAKINAAKTTVSTGGNERTLQLDKDAADRFIKGALASTSKR
ncbi:hypothetical protein IWW37_000154 [Coemansia sp. RSA 2050]|nr:hypothetical protein IWW37_000154 [Coemansia sp. RSA 2050]KAJ2735685.1 hypothetical protein IW152_001323 [Coemansia sp. BCRC 34962]